MLKLTIEELLKMERKDLIKILIDFAVKYEKLYLEKEKHWISFENNKKAKNKNKKISINL